MRQWYLVRCKPREDDRAEVQLCNQTYETYRPLARLRRRVSGRMKDRVESLFPGYLFIHLDPVCDNWSSVRCTRGVLDLVRFGDAPTPVPAGVVEAIRQREDPDHGWVDLTGASRFGRNQPVRIMEGPFAGQEALFQSAQGQDRVIVLLNVLQQSVRTTLPEAAIVRM